MHEIQTVEIDNISHTYKTFSIKVEKFITNDLGQVITMIEPEKGGRVRQAFVPGQIAEVISFIQVEAPSADLVNLLEVIGALWTPEVIAQYEQMLQSQNE